MANYNDGHLRIVRVPPRAPVLPVPCATPNGGAALLSAFCYPMPVPEFLSRHYQRRVVAFVGGGAARVAALRDALLCEGDLGELLRGSPSESISAWLRAPRAGGGTTQSLRLDAEGALVAHECGASLYCRAPQAAADALVPAFAEACGAVPAAAYYDARSRAPRGEVEVFASRAGHVTSWHTDFQCNFTLQMSGRKTWRVKAPAGAGARAPIRGVTPHFATAGAVVEEQAATHALARGAGEAPLAWAPPPSFFDDAQAVTLGPGDLLHFPAGAWHCVACDEDSLSVNVSVVGLSWADIAASAARHMLWRAAPQFRACAAMGPSAVGAESSGAEGVGSGAASELVPSGAPSASGRKRQRGSGDGGGGGGTGGGNGGAGRGGGTLARSAHALASAQEALAALRAAVLLLRPEDLLPPALRLSRRFSGLPGSDYPLDGDEQEEEEEAEEVEGGSSGDSSGGSSSGSSGGSGDGSGGHAHGSGSAGAPLDGSAGDVTAPGVCARFSGGVLMLSLDKQVPPLPPPALRASAFELNPLAVVLHERDTRDDARDPPAPIPGEAPRVAMRSFVVNVNLGSAASGEDLVPLSRAVLTFAPPHDGIAARVVEAVQAAASAGAGAAASRVRVTLEALLAAACAGSGGGQPEGRGVGAAAAAALGKRGRAAPPPAAPPAAGAPRPEGVAAIVYSTLHCLAVAGAGTLV